MALIVFFLRACLRVKAEKPDCRAFPLLAGDGMRPGAKRNYEVLSPLDFLAEFTQHIPPKGSHLVRHYGWYSNKSRGLRLKAARAATPQPAVAAEEGSASARPCNFTWARLIKRVYEVDPLLCPECETTMKVISFIEPPPEAVIEKILRHCGLWEEPARGPPAQSETADRDAVQEAFPISQCALSVMLKIRGMSISGNLPMGANSFEFLHGSSVAGWRVNSSYPDTEVWSPFPGNWTALDGRFST